MNFGLANELILYDLERNTLSLITSSPVLVHVLSICWGINLCMFTLEITTDSV